MTKKKGCIAFKKIKFILEQHPNTIINTDINVRCYKALAYEQPE